jgi:hypothetical protein
MWIKGQDSKLNFEMALKNTTFENTDILDSDGFS